MTSGVYKLTFSSGNFYIGKSIDISVRWKQHFDKFGKGTAAKNMQAEYNTFGYPNGEVLIECHADHVDIVEACLINRLKPTLNGTYPSDPFNGVYEGSFEGVLSYLNDSTLEHIIRLSRAEYALIACNDTIEKLKADNEILAEKRDIETISADVSGRIKNLADALHSKLAEINEMDLEMRTMHNEIMYHRRPWWQKVFN